MPAGVAPQRRDDSFVTSVNRAEPRSESFHSEPYRSEPYRSEPFGTEPYGTEPPRTEPHRTEAPPAPHRSEPHLVDGRMPDGPRIEVRRAESRRNVPRGPAMPSGPQVPTAPEQVRVPPTAASLYDTAKAAAMGASSRPATRRALKQGEARSRRAKPIIAGALALGLGGSALGYVVGNNLDSADAAFVVGDGVVAQTAELSRAFTVDTTYRAAASVSRNERRTAIVAANVADAAALEQKRQALAAKLARERQRKAELERLNKMRAQAIANARENPQAAAHVLMADFGWTSDAQFNCLVQLWDHESGWRWNADNPSSAAYGIPQSLPGSKMASAGSDWETNPLTQIKWGLGYIRDAYGSPCNAWGTWQSRYPHWY